MSAAPELGSFIGGRTAALGGDGVRLVRPQDGHTLGHVREAGEEGVRVAVAAAAAAFAAHRRTPAYQRVAWLREAATAVAGAAEELAALLVEDIDKPLRLARFEARRGADFIEGCAACLGQLGGETVPLDAAAAGVGALGIVRRVPYGVVGAITPFNAPINLLLQKVAPAIAAGNGVIAKPAPAGLRAALRLAELCKEAGWPDGLFNVLSGDRETARALAAHPEVRAVSFTGGTEGGDALARAAGAKKFVAELGSNAANLVMADADLARAAVKIAGAGFEASGQQCISAQRVLVARDVFDTFLPLLANAARRLRVSPAADPATDLGPMISEAAAMRIMAMVEDAVSRGARTVLEPTRTGATVSPGILTGVPRDARLWREEVFGPILVVTPFADEAEAIALANDSPFGLQGAVFTQSLGTALRLSDALEVGSLWINEASRFRLDMYPFGGVKQSGVGREGVRYAIEELSQLKFIGLRG